MRTVHGDHFAILASDGLCDLMSNEDAVVPFVSRLADGEKTWGAGTCNTTKERIPRDERGTLSGRKATPECFAMEDVGNAAVCW